MRVLLVNPNGSQATTDVMCRIVSTFLPGVAGWTAPEGPEMIVDDDALARAAGTVAALAMPAATRGIIVAAFGDPGCVGLAARLCVPVVGIGAAAARAAARRGPFGVATTTPALTGAIDVLMRTHAGGAAYTGCRVTDGDPVALMADPRALDAALIRAVAQAARDGARTVIIGGGPLGAAAGRLADRCAVPLVNPLIAAAREMRSALGDAARAARRP